MAGLGSAASPWPRPAGGTALAKRSTGSWWSVEAAWASRRSPSSSSRYLERACRGRRGGGGRGLALPVAGRQRGPRHGGAERAGGGRAGGRGAGSAFLHCGLGARLLPAGRPAWRRGSRASQECVREGGAGRVAQIHLIAPAWPEPFGRGSAVAPGFLPRSRGAGLRAWGWSPALWVSSRPGRLLHGGCDRGGNLAAAPRGVWASPRTLSGGCPLLAECFLFVCLCISFK